MAPMGRDMEEVIDTLDISEYDRADTIVDDHMEEILTNLGSDERIPQNSDEEWAPDVTYNDIACEILHRLRAQDGVSFKSVDGSCSGTPKDKVKVETVEAVDYNPLVKYRITCPGCYGKGEVNVRHGYNNGFECRNCGARVLMG